MTLTQRDYDIGQMEAELKMLREFEEWRTAFLGNRMNPLAGPEWQPMPPGMTMNPEGMMPPVPPTEME